MRSFGHDEQMSRSVHRLVLDALRTRAPSDRWALVLGSNLGLYRWVLVEALVGVGISMGSENECRVGKARCSAAVQSIGQSRCCHGPGAIEHEYRTLSRPEYEGILRRDGQIKGRGTDVDFEKRSIRAGSVSTWTIPWEISFDSSTGRCDGARYRGFLGFAVGVFSRWNSGCPFLWFDGNLAVCRSDHDARGLVLWPVCHALSRGSDADDHYLENFGHCGNRTRRNCDKMAGIQFILHVSGGLLFSFHHIRILALH